MHEFQTGLRCGQARDRHGASGRAARRAAARRRGGARGARRRRPCRSARAAGGRRRRGDVRQRERPALRIQGRHRLDRDDGLCHRPAARRDHRALRRQRAVGPDEHAWRWPRPPGAAFVREIFTGTYASRHGAVDARCRARRCATATASGAADLAMLYNVSAEFADCLDRRPLPDRARCAVFSSIPDAVLVSGADHRRGGARWSDLEAVKRVLPDTPVLANTGVKHATVADVLRVADGCIVGSALKVDGDTWNAGRSRPRRRVHGAGPRRAGRDMKDRLPRRPDRADADPRASPAMRSRSRPLSAARLDGRGHAHPRPTGSAT